MLCSEVWRVKRTKGEIGIEIEVEGDNLPPAPRGWKQVHDGSLRGESAEYVLSVPIIREEVTQYLASLFENYKTHRSRIRQSDRCSVHIHLNMQDRTISQTFSTILLFLIFETPLVHWCGETREGNHFCLRSQDAEFLLDFLEDLSTQTIPLEHIGTDLIRYAAINANSLAKYGSLEFRSMRGTDNADLISKWIKLLLKIKDFASSVERPTDIIELFSKNSVDEFIELIFEEESGIIFNYEDYKQAVYAGVRRVQPIAYLGKWDSIDRIVEPNNDI